MFSSLGLDWFKYFMISQQSDEKARSVMEKNRQLLLARNFPGLSPWWKI
jgi:hypothetical protein